MSATIVPSSSAIENQEQLVVQLALKHEVMKRKVETFISLKQSNLNDKTVAEAKKQDSLVSQHKTETDIAELERQISMKRKDLLRFKAIERDAGFQLDNLNQRILQNDNKIHHFTNQKKDVATSLQAENTILQSMYESHDKDSNDRAAELDDMVVTAPPRLATGEMFDICDSDNEGEVTASSGTVQVNLDQFQQSIVQSTQTEHSDPLRIPHQINTLLIENPTDLVFSSNHPFRFGDIRTLPLRQRNSTHKARIAQIDEMERRQRVAKRQAEQDERKSSTPRPRFRLFSRETSVITVDDDSETESETEEPQAQVSVFNFEEYTADREREWERLFNEGIRQGLASSVTAAPAPPLTPRSPSHAPPSFDPTDLFSPPLVENPTDPVANPVALEAERARARRLADRIQAAAMDEDNNEA